MDQLSFRQQFDELVEPLYAELMQVHQDHVLVFKEASDAMDQGLAEQAARDMLVKANLALGASHEKVVARVVALRGGKGLEVIQAFIDGMLKYFDAVMDWRTPLSKIVQLTEGVDLDRTAFRSVAERKLSLAHSLRARIRKYHYGYTPLIEMIGVEYQRLKVLRADDSSSPR